MTEKTTSLERNCSSRFVKRTLLCGVFGLLFSCTPQEKSSQTADTVTVTSPTLKRDISSTKTTSTSNQEKDQEDCVFNNDYKGLTTDWLAELRITEFIWREDLKQALVPKGQDTVFLSKGGCTHFGLLVELKLTNDHHDLTDSTYWIDKALALSVEYRMEHYEKMIREGKIKRTENAGSNVWYEIDDDDTEDNMIYNGVEISQEGNSKKVNISEYIN